MADVRQIELGNTYYPAKDLTARDAIADLQSHEKFRVTGNASEGTSVTFTDARINSEHWRVPKNGIYFGTPSNVTSAISWTTNITNHTITLQATFAGATTVDIDMEWYQ